MKNKNKVKPQVINEAGGKYDLQLFYDTYIRYIEFSRYLFGTKNPIYDINEMPGNSDFFTDAVKMAEQLNVDWEGMSHEDSNRVMLALLEDYYQAMAKVANKKQLAIEVNLKIIK